MRLEIAIVNGRSAIFCGAADDGIDHYLLLVTFSHIGEFSLLYEATLRENGPGCASYCVLTIRSGGKFLGVVRQIDVL